MADRFLNRRAFLVVGATPLPALALGSIEFGQHHSNFDFAFHVAPLLSRPQHSDQLVECGGIRGSELEPRQKVELLAEVAAVMKPPRDPWQIREAAGDVMRALLEDCATSILRKRPPPG